MPELPWHLPARQWTDEQLLTLLREQGNVSDERLLEMAAQSSS
jgi:hypothetical protein